MSTPWSVGISFETGWTLATDLVAVVIALLIVLDTGLRFDQIAGRMAGGTVATTVDEFLHGRQNQPVFVPAKTKKTARKTETKPLPETIPHPLGSVDVVSVD